MALAQGDAAEEAATASVRQGFALTLAVFGTLFVVTLCAQLPALWMPSWLGTQRTTYSEVWPQDWAFFASQPDAPAVSAYRIGPAGTPASVLTPQMSAANLWGLGRTSTVKFNETHALAAEVPAKDWIVCTDTRSAECVDKAPVVYLQNGFSPGTVCGRLILVRTRPAVTAPKSGSVASVGVGCR
ncbi:SdpA family antimicrobial peptide system protein [Streptacidiphilus sp. PB12-B1b]|uniref:SdpA family antimicrobial peptide system protein n=1 Tax=Streptacidiphilus sp. PB12-B1b TaxID=2705012 RepID=UPI0015FC0002|nr:SdpA family antimicrobial peptide system protein [Streptacidiphilus sp. PB12-B1b]QMU74625.1 SdpA family antimicrobial peptide system protein [Streptacidiphilus sp. PB12-B1b]